MSINQLKQYWQQLIEQCELNSDDCAPIFSGIISAYEQPHRVYHNLSHLQHFWSVLGSLPDSVEVNPAMQLALWYHDIVYQPGKSDNEIKSTQRLIADNISLKFSDYILNTACQLIMATQTHKPRGDLNCSYFLDADMAILGSDTDSYQVYSRAVADEHQQIPSFFYRRGRKKFLTQTLAQPLIFHTPHFNQMFEAQARINLQNELAHL